MENLDSCASCRTIRLTVSSLGMYNHCPIINDPSSATWNFVSTPASTFFLILDPSFSRNWACSICSRYVGHTNSWATNPPPELMSKSAPISFRNRQRKLRCCRCRNRQRNLSHYIYIYIYISFGCLQKQSPCWTWNDQWILSDSWVWNRQRHWSHYRRIKSIAKIESWLTHGIVKNAMSQLIHKSPAKTEQL